MRKLVRLFVVPALAVLALVAFAGMPAQAQSPQPVPPVIRTPGPIGPAGGPVDPTPTQPPPSS